MNYSYYPGCTLHSTGAEYGASVGMVFDTLGVGLTELPDWNCCGASSAHGEDRDLAVLLPGRNLLLAQQLGMRMVVPCAACFGRLRAAKQTLAGRPELCRRLEKIVGVAWDGGVAVESALSVVAGLLDGEAISSRVVFPLAGLKVAPYYGCFLARPGAVTGERNPDNPTSLDRVLRALGAEVVEWSYKTDCCGGGLSLSRSDLVSGLVDRLVDRAMEAGAQCMATACPMCQANLEMRQRGGRKFPVFYFTELMGLAFDPERARDWWMMHLIDVTSALEYVGLPTELCGPMG